MNFEILPNGNLKITSTKEDRPYLEDMLDTCTDTDHGFMAELLEYTGWASNGRLHQVAAESIGALTDAPILTDEMDFSDEAFVPTGRIWWFPDYAVVSFAQELIRKGEVAFAAAPQDKTVSALA